MKLKKLIPYVAAGGLALGVGCGKDVADYLPEGFDEVTMGMNYQEVQNVRPFVKTGREEGEAYEELSREGQQKFLGFFKGDSTRFVKRMNENFTRGGKVEYSFSNNQLIKIKFGFHGTDCNSKSLTQKFRRGAEEMFGEGTSKGKYGVVWEEDEFKAGMVSSGTTYYYHFYYVIGKKEENNGG